MRGLEKKVGNVTQGIRLKRVGLREIDAVEMIKTPTFVSIILSDNEEESFCQEFILENNEYYFIKSEDEIIGKIGITNQDDEYAIKEFLVLDEYNDNELQNNIMNHIKSMYPEAQKWSNK
jgi:hypothetical protein